MDSWYRLQNNKRGFSLIELMVVISIILLITSIVIAAVTNVRAKTTDTVILAEVHQYQNALAIAISGNGTIPDPGDTTNYYCLGKTASQSCTFWSNSYTGNAALVSAVSMVAPTAVNSSISVNGQTFQGAVYKCKTRSGSSCTEAAVYWAESIPIACPVGMTVVSGSPSGVVCGQNAGSGDTSAVEAAPSGGVCTKCIQ